MKKLALALVALICILAPNMAKAASEKTYEVPVSMKHATEDKPSMANGALKPVAEVKEIGGKMVYQISVKPMNFMNMSGNLTNLFVLNGADRAEAQKSAAVGEFTQVFSFERSALKENSVDIAVWVDVMDSMQGGKPGAGEQKARLVFDWAKAKELKAPEKPEQPKQPAQPKKPGNKEVTILVNGKVVKSDSPIFIVNNRTMVPLRYISEALGLKVNWDDKTRTALVGEGKGLMKLPIGKGEIIKADGKKIKIDVPAMIKNNRTMVPLRAIGEISGAKVNWNDENRQVIVNK